jgi:hypothetical protein
MARAPAGVLVVWSRKILERKDGHHMASNGKTKITMAKRARESKLRERRLEKQAKKQARKLASADQADQGDRDAPEVTEEGDPGVE